VGVIVADPEALLVMEVHPEEDKVLLFTPDTLELGLAEPDGVMESVNVPVPHCDGVVETDSEEELQPDTDSVALSDDVGMPVPDAHDDGITLALDRGDVLMESVPEADELREAEGVGDRVEVIQPDFVSEDVADIDVLWLLDTVSDEQAVGVAEAHFDTVPLGDEEMVTDGLAEGLAVKHSVALLLPETSGD